MNTAFDPQTAARHWLSDLPVLETKITAALGCRADQVADAICEALRFLQLVAEQKHGKLTPSHRVDLVWHELILCTRAYAEFCESNFGRFIHHQPGGEDADNRRQFTMTLKRYQAKFGIPNPLYWGVAQNGTFRDGQAPEHSECGICEAD